MTTYLSKLKKADLQDLAKKAGVKDDGLLKDDLIVALEAELRTNSSKHQVDKAFTEFYARSSPGAKKSRASEAPEGKEPTKRRKTITTSDASSLVPATPASIHRLAQRVRLPGSPAISRAVTAQTNKLSSSYKRLVKKSNIKNRAALIRQELSSVETIQLLTLIFEAAGLRRFTLPFAPATIPAVDSLRLKDTTVWVPVLSTILTRTFWAPTILWLLTSIIVPGVFAYLFNLTYQNPRPRTRRTVPVREFDPLTFSIVKALIAWVVYAPQSNFRFFGLFSERAVTVVNNNIYGGYFTILIGAAVGVLTSLYDNLSFKS